jgi:hypothetical protein
MGAIGGLDAAGATGIGGRCIAVGGLATTGAGPPSAPFPGGIFGKGGNFGAPGAPVGGAPAGGPAFGGPGNPAGGAPAGGPAFGGPGNPAGGPAFGGPGNPAGGAPAGGPAFGGPGNPADAPLVGKADNPDVAAAGASALSFAPVAGCFDNIENSKFAACCFGSLSFAGAAADATGSMFGDSTVSSFSSPFDGFIPFRSFRACLILFLNSSIPFMVSSIEFSRESKLLHKKSNKLPSLSLAINFHTIVFIKISSNVI